jgi:TetR/AcrR family transcriptional regulator, mexJK operon transcriptional repressor
LVQHQTLEPEGFKRGRGGRPTRQEAERRHLSLLTAATRLFLENGWDGASVDEISRRSGVAKRFIYTRYPDKAALFVAALQRYLDEQIEVLHEIEPQPVAVEDGLYGLGERLLDIALRPETLAFHRLLISEAPKFPDLAKQFVERNRRRAIGEVRNVLAGYARRGLIQSSDLKTNAEQFFILVIGIPQRLALLIGRDEAESSEQHLKAAVRLFLDGCRKRQKPARPSNRLTQ